MQRTLLIGVAILILPFLAVGILGGFVFYATACGVAISKDLLARTAGWAERVAGPNPPGRPPRRGNDDDAACACGGKNELFDLEKRNDRREEA